MADKYTYADVIIDPEEPRVEIGKEYYTSKNIPDALFKANEGDEMFCYKLLSVHNGAYAPFWMDKDSPDSFDFLIRKKAPKKKYVPFDLTKEEDRARLRGAWVRKKDNSEIKLIWWLWEMDGKWMIDEDISPQELLDNWVFDFEGFPCGKLVEEE